MPTAWEASARLHAAGNPAFADHAQRFFKTAPGQYGHGDTFLGIRVPTVRAMVKDYAGLRLTEVVKLLRSSYHEERLFALLVLIRQFDRADPAGREEIYTLYLKHTRSINNWDLVDVSAPNIVGTYLLDKDRHILYTLAASPVLWERRIAMLATFAFIRKNEIDDALAIARLLRDDLEELIHKAVGWMLREVGKRNLNALTMFLDQHAADLPRTMLRYAIEKLPNPKRLHYMKKK